MELTLLEILTGLFNLIFVIISSIVGLKILSKYAEYEKNYYIYVGITWIGISTPWLHGALAFVLLFFNIILDETIRFIIGYAFIPIITVLWLFVFTDFMYRDKRKIILALYIIISLICEILFFFFLFTDRVNMIGYFERTFSAVYRPFVRFTLIFFLITALITFLLFARESINSGDVELKLKGKFLIIAFIIYAVCAVLDSFFLFQPVIVVMVRILLMISSVMFYFGWILPKPVKNALIK
jgi:hypothetical protein